MWRFGIYEEWAAVVGISCATISAALTCREGEEVAGRGKSDGDRALLCKGTSDAAFCEFSQHARALDILISQMRKIRLRNWRKKPPQCTFPLPRVAQSSVSRTKRNAQKRTTTILQVLKRTMHERSEQAKISRVDNFFSLKRCQDFSIHLILHQREEDMVAYLWPGW